MDFKERCEFHPHLINYSQINCLQSFENQMLQFVISGYLSAVLRCTKKTSNTCKNVDYVISKALKISRSCQIARRLPNLL